MRAPGAADRRRLLGALLGPGEAELTCEQCFAELDRYVELQLAGTEADRLVLGMRAHLEGCPACREDHDSLLALAAGEAPRASMDPG